MDAEALPTLLGVAVVLVYVLAVVSAFEAVLKARTAQGAIAWTISLVAFPVLTVPIYLVFGRNRFTGYLEQREFIEAESRRLIEHTSGNVAEHIVPVTPEMPVYGSLSRLARMPATELLSQW